jgi:hypothetical protein
VLRKQLADRIQDKVRAAITERILKEAGLERQVKAAIAAIDPPDAAALKLGIEQLFTKEQDKDWRAHIEEVAEKAAKSVKDEPS